MAGMTEPDAAATDLQTDDVLRERDEVRAELIMIEAEAIEAQRTYENAMATLRERLRLAQTRAAFLEGVLTGRGVPLGTSALIATSGKG